MYSLRQRLLFTFKKICKLAAGLIVLLASMKKFVQLFINQSSKQEMKADLSLQKAEKELAATLNLLQRTGEMAKVGGWELELSTGKVFMSTETLRIHEIDSNYTPPLYSTGDQWYPPEVWPMVQAAVGEAIAHAKPYDLKLPFITATGRKIWVRIQGFPKVVEGKVTKLEGTFQDITEQHRSEEKMTELTLFISNLFNAMTDGFAVMDPQGIAVEVNPSFCSMIGFTREELIGHGAPRPYWPPEEIAKIQEAFSKTLDQKQNAFELLFMRKNGERFPVLVTPSKIVDTNGNVTHFAATIKDLTEKKRQEQLLRESELKMIDNLKLASQLKSEFLSTVSHEIRTPLNGIIGMCSLLQETELQPEQKECADTIESSSKLLLSLINDILDFSKIEAGKMTLEDIEFNLCDYLSEISKPFELLANKKGLGFKFKNQGSDRNVIADPGRIGQIILNLLSNAIKFTKNGEVTIQAELSPQDSYTSVVISIHDTGIGIKDAAKEKIFTAFSQAESSTTREFGGTGLGLSISKQLTDLMNGKISFESVSGKGSTFRVELLLKTGNLSKTKANVPTQAKNLNLSGRILVAEDNTTNQIVIERILSIFGCKFQIVANGKEALEAIRKSKFELIIMDCQMPEMDGYTASRILTQRDSPHKNIPIVALTANTAEDAEERCRKVGMSDFLTKPIDRRALETVLKKHLAPISHLR